MQVPALRTIPPRAIRILPVVIAVGWSLGFCIRLLVHVGGGSQAHLAFLTDDAYYYLGIARNIAATGSSAFDGVTSTNGYHPLWMLILVGLTKLCGGQGVAFFASLAIVLFAASIWTYFEFQRVLTLCFGDSLATGLFALLGFLMSLSLIWTGMEVALTIPLLAHVIAQGVRLRSRSKPGGFAPLGFASSLLVLSRLDSAIAVALLLGWLIWPRSATGPGAFRRLALFGLGGMLVPAYLVSNRLLFDTLLPISGVAKHLASGLFPDPSVVLRSFLLSKRALLLVLATAAGWTAAVLDLYLAGTRRAWGLFLLFTWPLLYYLILAASSDWGLWPWYFYPLPLSGAAAMTFVVARVSRSAPGGARRRPRVLTASGCAAGALVAAYLQVALFRDLMKPAERNALYEAALEVEGFARTHPGRYAMGDRAGLMGYLLPGGVFQLEGIVGDMALIRQLQAQVPLPEVLAERGATYLIATNPSFDAGCWIVEEPRQAGRRSPRLRGRFCTDARLDFSLPEFEGGEARTVLLPVAR